MIKSVSLSVATLLVLALAAIALLTSPSSAQSKAGPQAAAYWRNGVLTVTLLQPAPRTGKGTLVLEVLDPEDAVISKLSRDVYAISGQPLPPENLTIRGGMLTEDLVWHRLRYRFTYDRDTAAAMQSMTSISRVIRQPVVHVLGQPLYLSGSAAAVRLLVTEPDSTDLVASGNLRIELVGAGPDHMLYSGPLNERGTTRASFHFPAGMAGNYAIRYSVDTPLGDADYTQQVRLEDQVSILLTTEKPVYQPGQAVHVRALALNRATHQATAGRYLTFEMEDARGNKIFRDVTRTDSWGVASTEFKLAGEVNLGAWHLRAVLGSEGPAPTRSEIALQVERYVLPRFKVDLDLAGKGAAAKRGYRPGDHITGTVRSNYFFGKAVEHAAVIVEAKGRDVTPFSAGKAAGITEGDGTFRFDIQLPEFLAGDSMNKGAALVMIEATVKDNAGHSEVHSEPVTVSESALMITVVPESEGLLEGVENQLFILAAYPDGTPARASVRVAGSNADAGTAETDGAGVAVVRVMAGRTMTHLRVEAKDREGNKASVPVNLPSRSGDQILLRTKQALYRPGDRIRLQLLSTVSQGSGYVDLVRDGQTIGTYDVLIVAGQAKVEIPVTAEMAGTVGINAYFFGSDARPVRDHRLIFVQPADELRIETTLDSPVYKPGSEARIGFHVTDRRGEGVEAALGVEIIDQAVFAMAEKQPGFAKAFFYLEQEVMKPRYEIHSVRLPELLTSPEPIAMAQRDRAAQALFSAMETIHRNKASWDFGRGVLQTKLSAYLARYRVPFDLQSTRIEDLSLPVVNGNAGVCGQALSRAGTLAAATADSWGNELRAQATSGVRTFEIRSAGPDGRLFTADDLTRRMEDPACVAGAPAGTIGVRFEAQRGPANGLADIAGVVGDASGAVIPDAEVRIVEAASGRVHTVHTGPEGRFLLASLPVGRYTVSAMMPGFATARTDLTLKEGDRALLSATLQVGSTSQTVEVMSASGSLNTEMAVRRHVPTSLTTPPVASRAALTLSMHEELLSRHAPQPAAADTHVRSWFPESLYVAPEIITDRSGHASITIPIADNITTWRMAMLASTKNGALGSGTSSLKVLQDFFTELDLPVTLTQGDEVSIPVAIYNYSGSPGNVNLRIDRGEWFSLPDHSAEKSVPVETGRVAASQFTIAANRIGKFRLTLRAEMKGAAERADIVVREIEVVPNGREQNLVFNGRLESAVHQNVSFPSTAIPEANAILVRLYPGAMSQIVEGMDSLLQMPYGCFEQTSSSTYPNVLALDYMKRTKKVTPEISAKASGYIANGYQRLVTFEVPGGGFSWFGQAPANKILTAYGLMEFNDMSKVHDVDEKVIRRTQEWLASQQQPDGSWKPDMQFINEGVTNRFNNDSLRITGYIAWALESSAFQGTAVDRAKRYIETRLGGASPDVYTLAVLANFAADYGKDESFTNSITQLLLNARREEGDKVWWAAAETSLYGRGESAVIETTGLAVQALLKHGEGPAIAAKAMNYISSKKTAAGAWGTTQATIMALRALLLAADRSGGSAKGTAEILVRGKTAATVVLTAENNDLLHQFVFKDVDPLAANEVEIRFKGAGGLAYQITGRYFTPWNERPAGEPLSIDISYDRTHLEQDQVATATATVRNNLSNTSNMVMVDLGIPPGFELLTEDLDSYREKTARRKNGRLEKFSLTATHAVLYFDSLAPNAKLVIPFRLRAKYPIRTQTFASRVYEYYAPETGGMARPVQLEVRRR